MASRYGLDICGLEYRLVAGSHEYGTEPSGFMKAGNYLKRPERHVPSQKDAAIKT
jgi:hypothetical protein